MGVIIGGALAGWDILTTYVAERYYESKYGIETEQPEVYAEKATFGAAMALVPTPGGNFIAKTFYKAPAIAIQSWMSYLMGKLGEEIWKRLFGDEKPTY